MYVAVRKSQNIYNDRKEDLKMDTIKHKNELKDMPATYHQVFQNTFTNSIDKTKVVTAKYNNIIEDIDVVIAQFLFRFRFATIEQIYKYLDLKGYTTNEDTEESIKVRLDKLVKTYKVLNKFVLSPFDFASFVNDLEFYCLDLGGAFLLHNFTDETLESIRSWRPKNANLHTPQAVYRDFKIVEFYLKLLDIFGETLISFEPYKRMTYDKNQVTITFDFCVEKDSMHTYFIGEIMSEEDLIQRFGKSADAIEQIVSTNAWRKYYLDIDVPPVILYITDDDDSALEIARSLALRQINKFRITTLDRLEDSDLSTAFMVFDKEANELRLGKSKFFEK